MFKTANNISWGPMKYTFIYMFSCFEIRGWPETSNIGRRTKSINVYGELVISIVKANHTINK